MTKAADPILIYDRQADALAERYEAVSSEILLAEVLSAMPQAAAGRLALDIGAGTGRDAAWLSGLGYQVVAVEPAAGMRRVAATRHAGREYRPGRARTGSWQVYSFRTFASSPCFGLVRPTPTAMLKVAPKPTMR